MKLMIGILFISLAMFVVAIAYAAVLTTLTLLFTTRQKSTSGFLPRNPYKAEVVVQMISNSTASVKQEDNFFLQHR